MNFNHNNLGFNPEDNCFYYDGELIGENEKEVVDFIIRTFQIAEENMEIIEKIVNLTKKANFKGNPN